MFHLTYSSVGVHVPANYRKTKTCGSILAKPKKTLQGIPQYHRATPKYHRSAHTMPAGQPSATLLEPLCERPFDLHVQVEPSNFR
jgi:hypothetical protein